MSDRIVIVGGGIAGQAVCEALRDRDGEIEITLVCGESSAPYDRVRLSEILVSGEDPETLQLRPLEWYADHDVDLLLGRWRAGSCSTTASSSRTTSSCWRPARSR